MNDKLGSDILTDNEQESKKRESTEENSTENSNFENIADSLIDTLPPVSYHVVEAHQQKETEREQQNAQKTDKRGDIFNADIHAVDDNGDPKFTAAGYFAKRRGRKSGGSNSEKKSTLGINQDPLLIQKQKQRAAGSAAANSLIMLGIVLCGDEWQPIRNEEHGINEKANLEMAFSDYFEQNGLEDIPAGVALAIAVSGYMLPRFTMPKTRARSATLLQKIKAWWANRKLKRHGLKAVSDSDKKAEK